MVSNINLANLINASIFFSMAFSLIVCFFGYRLQKVFYAISGFVIGAFLGALIIVLVCPKNEYFLTILIVTALILGIVGAIVSFKFYRIGVFFYMFSTVFSVIYCLSEAILKEGTGSSQDISLLVNNISKGNFSNVNWEIVIVSAVVSVIIGIITIKYIRNIMISVTAISGGINFSTVLLANVIKFNNLIVILLVAAAVAVLGITFQFKTTKKSYHRK